MSHVYLSRVLRTLTVTVLMILTLGLVCGLTACGGDDTSDPGDGSDSTGAVTEPATDPSADTADPAGTEASTAPAGDETDPAEVETSDPIVDVMIGETLDAEPAADFTVSGVFSSDMVVQRGEHLRVWGWAPESENGKKVSGEFMGMFAEALIENGEWELTFGARLEACAELGNSMRLYAGENKEYVFEDVLVGDVYMVIGQSNVRYSVAAHLAVNNTADKGGESVLDDNAPIRLHYNSHKDHLAGYPTRGTDEVCEDLRNGSTWTRANRGNIYNFSAIAYYFAYHLLELTDDQIPIGLIEIDGDGQPLGAFMPNEVAEACGSDSFNSSKGYYTTTGVNGDAARYMYNHYMYPFERYAMAGLVWYQGESDYESNNAKVYAENFTALMTYMRGTHNLINADFPVYFVELPTIYKAPAGWQTPAGIPGWMYMDVGLVRSIMGSIPQYLPNSYQAVSSDLWSNTTHWNNLHPDCKYEQAARLANLAAAVTYDVKSMDEATGPILLSVELSENKKTAVLTYGNVGEGLRTADGGDLVTGFMGARENYRLASGSMISLEARITATNQITVTCSTAIDGIAYNAVTTNFYGTDINLCNSYGCPAGAVIMYAEEE